MTDEPARGLTSLEALGVAIRSEMDAQAVYREMAQRTTEPRIRRRFENLAADEEQHATYLKERYRKLAGGVELKLPPSQLPGGMATPEERRRMTMLQVLDVAIEEERQSRNFYLSASRETQDPSGQEMFRFLADLEYQHWMALSHERDLLLQYPNYGLSGETPWRAEKSMGGQ